jgi:dual specificity MAP kinase phosphatase
MATAVVQQQTLRHTTPPPTSISPPLNLSKSPSPAPHKHVPAHPPDPSLVAQFESRAATDGKDAQQSSLLYPPDGFSRVTSLPPVYSIDAETLAAALDHLASQPLPDPNHVFPWFHGLHPDNHFQVGFFTNRKRGLRQIPRCWRGITVIKIGGDLSKAKLRGAVSPDEVLSPSSSEFLMADPREGFSVRNFQIQTAKLAPLSDIVIYGEDGLNHVDILDAAGRIASAQHDWNMQNFPEREKPHFNTFILSG